MPMQSVASRRRIAVIGAGISGLGAAHALAGAHHVTVFEAEPRPGGHARTVIAGRRGDQPVDTGFIVFNRVTYPNLTRLFSELGVAVVPSDMSFGASVRGGRLEYGLRGARAFFAQRRNAFDPRFLGMLRDIFRFNREAPGTIATTPDLTIAQFLDRLGTGRWFRDYYLLPFTGAIWSAPAHRIADFPAHAMIRFMTNHGLMSHRGQHQWLTVQGGSVRYVEKLCAALAARGAELRTRCPVAALRRVGAGVEVRPVGGVWERFDEVILATHSDVSLALLADPDPAEAAALGALRYQPNDVVLHADASVMPRRRAVWSSWNYTESPARRDDRIDITYWMNRLQPIPQSDPLFVTLNSNRPIREELIYDRVTLHHPVCDLAALRARGEVRAMNGARNTWFCGAWMGDGFHEDGLASGLDVAGAILGRDATLLAAE